MGFFSWDCRGCGHPMLSHWSINKINYWMQSVVAIESKGALREGFYDGYGRVIPYEEYEAGRTGSAEDRINNSLLDDGYQDPECWHRACWEIAGEPTEYTEPSTSPRDQGFFFEDEHNMEKPTKEDPDDPDGCPDCGGEGMPLTVDADLERYSKCGNCKGWLPLEEEA